MMPDTTPTEEPVLLEGAIAILAVLEFASRPLHRIVIEERVRYDRDAARIRKLSSAAGVPIEYSTSEAITALAKGTSHGGIVALAGTRRFETLNGLIVDRAAPFVVMLDGIEDPYNFGQAVRAFYAAGADGLVLRPRNWMSAAGIVARASAGASERMPSAVAETVEAAAAHYRAQGLQIMVADKERSTSLYEADLTRGTFLVVGGEKRGVTRSFAYSADLRVHIPYGREYPYSLGTVAAASALAFEMLRQRKSIG